MIRFIYIPPFDWHRDGSISNVFKWQFENTTIFNFQLSIFN